MAVQFIEGASGSGKTAHLHDMIKLASEVGQVILFVPEQFTYETEKILFVKLGAARFKNVRVTSFTRFCRDVFKTYGGISGIYASDSAKAILMDMAVESLSDNIDVYKKSAKHKSFADFMLDTVSELKNAGISPEDLSGVSKMLDANSHIAKKTAELSLIYQTYNALLYQAYKDSLDDIHRATRILQQHTFFNDCTVFIDEFKGFTANENDMLRLILSTSLECYVALCIDSTRADSNDYGVFASVVATKNMLTRFAREQSVKILPPIKLTAQKRLSSPQLTHLEQNLFSSVTQKYSGSKCDDVTVMLCKNEYDEIDYILATVTDLVMNYGYAYDDIAIISRDIDTYTAIINSGCKKYNVPFFLDNRIKITTKPLVRFVKHCIECVVSGYKSEDVLSLLKCGLTRFNIKEISELENYVLVWGINKSGWKKPFEQCPRGFSPTMTKRDIAVLETINTVREYVIGCLKCFEKAVKSEAPARLFCIALLQLIEDFELKEHTERIIQDNAENAPLAQEYTRVWELLIENIDTLAVVLGDTKVSAARFLKLFNLIIEMCDLGVLPQSLDCIIVGSADRIRISGKRAVFVMGVNENVFPLTPTESGAFTDKERQTLIELSLSLSPPIKKRILEERFIVYKTLTAPTNRLYLTARCADVSGKPMMVSPVIGQLKRMFGSDIIRRTSELCDEYFCKTRETAFANLARQYHTDTPFVSSLISALTTKDSGSYESRLLVLNNVADKRHYELFNKANARQLFGDKMRISPTRVEGYYQCAFKYFCEYGLKLRPIKKAELNPLETGTLIHFVVHGVTSEIDLKKDFDADAVKALITQKLSDYIVSVMGGEQDKTSRFIYLYKRMVQSIYKLIFRLHEELVQSAFTPSDFEYEISEQSDIKPLTLQAQNGVVITVSGKVDRIDTYANAKGQKFVRIIDYKSGKKEFSLSDVLCGLNLQMLIYLFCIKNGGVGRYDGAIPAGILYMTASEAEPTLDRDATQKDTDNLRAKHYQMSGLILNDDEIIEAMDNGSEGIFIPISKNKDGSLSKKSYDCLATLAELAKLDKYINTLIINMANELLDGHIKAVPLENTCGFCSYSAICALNQGSGISAEVKTTKRYSRSEIMQIIDKGVDESGGKNS